jgi:hypothetical protein
MCGIGEARECNRQESDELRVECKGNLMTENFTASASDDSGEFVLYQTEDGQTRIEVRLSHETIWLPQRLIAELFQVSVPTVNEHLRSIYEDAELDPTATIRKFRIVQIEGSRSCKVMLGPRC